MVYETIRNLLFIIPVLPFPLQHFYKIASYHTPCLKPYLFAIRGFVPVAEWHTGWGLCYKFIHRIDQCFKILLVAGQSGCP